MELATVPEAASPEAASLCFARAVASGDGSAALACLSREACVISPDGTSISAPESIGSFLAQLKLVHPRIQVEAGRMLTAGAVAVGTQCWRVIAKGSAGELYEQVLCAQFVLRRERGSWRVLVAAPWGW